MRLWSIHPRYLDVKGFCGLWREALLARRVLKGETEKYRHHPQLDRFRNKPISFINTYLSHLYKESCRRGYCFDKRKITKPMTRKKIEVTQGQLEHEIKHLKKKLKIRAPDRYKELLKIKKIEANPLFAVKKGDIEKWEKR